MRKKVVLIPQDTKEKENDDPVRRQYLNLQPFCVLKYPVFASDHSLVIDSPASLRTCRYKSG